MKNEPSSTLRMVWAMKEAAQKETEGLTGHAYFEYVHRKVADLNLHLPVAKRHRRRRTGTHGS